MSTAPPGYANRALSAGMPIAAAASDNDLSPHPSNTALAAILGANASRSSSSVMSAKDIVLMLI